LLLSFFSFLRHASGRKKVPKAAGEGSDNDEVTIVNKPSEDTEACLIQVMYHVSKLIVGVSLQMGDTTKGINASIHAPKAGTAEGTKNLRFSKDKKNVSRFLYPIYLFLKTS